MRGKESSDPIVQVGVGITPACAGKSCYVELVGLNVKDHPRVCGEKYYPANCGVTIQGSPSRVRGKAKGLKIRFIISRITPACAGKSLLEPIKGQLH